MLLATFAATIVKRALLSASKEFGIEKLELVAPGITVSFLYHCKVGGGFPPTPALKLAGCNSPTIWLWGGFVITAGVWVRLKAAGLTVMLGSPEALMRM